MYRGAEKSLARPGRKQTNVSVRIVWISFGVLPCKKKKIDDSSHLDVVEIARFPYMLSLPGRPKDLPAPRYWIKVTFVCVEENLTTGTSYIIQHGK